MPKSKERIIPELTEDIQKKLINSKINFEYIEIDELNFEICGEFKASSEKIISNREYKKGINCFKGKIDSETIQKVIKKIQYPETTYADWKTYTNQEYNFSISLPSGWQETKDFVKKIPGDINFQGNSLYLVNTNENKRSVFFISAWRILYPIEDPLRFYQEKYYGSKSKIIKKENIETNYENFIFLEYKIPNNVTPENTPPYSYLFHKENTLIAIQFTENNEMTKKILNTFKYLK